MAIHPSNEPCHEGMAPTPPRAYVPRPDAHSALPVRVTKAQAISIVARALHALAMPSAVIAAWRLIADQAEASAWHSHRQTPMNFRKARDLARELGVSERHWRRIEVQLEDAGVLFRATTDNGFRGKAAGGQITFGLSLEPMLAQFEAFEALAKKPEQEANARKHILGQIRALRKRLKALDSFDPLSAEHRAQWATLEEVCRPTRPSSAEMAVLEHYLSELTGFEEVLRRREFVCQAQHSAPPSAQTVQDEVPYQPTATQQEQTAGIQTSQVAALTVDPQGLTHTNPAKMSDAADSHVRRQYNLEYNNKRLNACHEGNQQVEDPAGSREPGRNSAEHWPDHQKPAEGQEGITRSKPEAIRLRSNQNGTQTLNPHENPINQVQRPLPANSLLDLRLIERLFDHPELLGDVRACKAGTSCAKLDPQHIWQRFRRYNLKRDKHILPIAALRAFIKGWIPDGQTSYLDQQAGDIDQPKNRSAQAAAKPKPTREETIAFYKAALESGKYVPPNMVPNWVMEELA